MKLERSPHAAYAVRWAQTKNAPVPLQGQMRENTSAVPPCLTENSAHLSQAPTRPKPDNAGFASRNTHGASPLSTRPRRSICRFAARELSAWAPSSLCVRCRFDLRLNGFYQFSTMMQTCQYWSCSSLVFPSSRHKQEKNRHSLVVSALRMYNENVSSNTHIAITHHSRSCP